MMTKDADKNRMQIQYFCMNDLVPEDHLLRLIEEAIDWGFIYVAVHVPQSFQARLQAPCSPLERQFQSRTPL